MYKILRRALSLALAAAVLAGGLILPAVASGASEESVRNADRLNALGLFNGTENGYELNSAPDRTQGLVMLIRLLGQEEAALASGTETPFTDVLASSWSAPYVAYGYETGLTSGVESSLFGGSRALTARDYVTFLLRSLGYSDADGDFTWQYALSFAAQIGMMTTDAAVSLSQASAFNRGDMVDLSCAALTCRLADGSATLAEKLAQDGVFTAEQGAAQGVIGAGAIVYTYTPYQPPREEGPGIEYVSKTFATASGSVKADVITVDPQNPKVTIKAQLVGNKLGATASFADIVKQSGATAVINANYFNSDGGDKFPIGNIMSEGNLIYGMGGYTTMGITGSGEIRWGRPSLAVRLVGPEGPSRHWFARAVNVSPKYFTSSYPVMYTPAYGESVTAPVAGYAIQVRNNAVTAYTPFAAGASVAIPADGFVMLIGTAVTQLYGYAAPAVGTAVTAETYLFTEDAQGFDPTGVVAMVAGSPCLIENGVASSVIDPAFSADKFVKDAAPRTAVGSTADGHLILLSTGSATATQLKEVMRELGCVNAVCLDGGGSCAMYYNGQTLHSPGRQLTSTLQIFVR